MFEHLYEIDGLQFGGESEVITNELWICISFAIRAEDDNDKGVNYYVLFVLRPRFWVQLLFICLWGDKFRTSDYTIKYMYYQKFGRNEIGNYIWLIRSQPTYIHADSVRATNFPMVIQNHHVS